MPRFAGVSAGVLLLVAVVAVVAALSGCSSSSGGDGARPKDEASSPAASANATPDTGGARGRIDYTGSVTGGFDVTSSVGCRILAGDLKAVTAPDADGDSSGFEVPSFVTTTGNVSIATLITPDDHTFEKVGAKGVSAVKQGDTWTVTVSGMKLRADDGSGGTVTVDGHLTCTKTHGTDAP
ncbi:hypothetical protein [Actinacidiphila bryophytorum]|uniref:Lipoprotein n=1 Tax=Actinacidiphila bryophytorum TaxID=1436133 RepID=A0A9W4GYG6_9ACTN|nr:hypothetical protein [Actinacidiphila bryophytorum]MBM9436633.1 hypothetical protein [Actinacidiphila bryophytorum]CAG7599086.1 conserved exported hypothetical protein [Actinacidiphila bryophytorum]